MSFPVFPPVSPHSVLVCRLTDKANGLHNDSMGRARCFPQRTGLRCRSHWHNAPLGAVVGGGRQALEWSPGLFLGMQPPTSISKKFAPCLSGVFGSLGVWPARPATPRLGERLAAKNYCRKAIRTWCSANIQNSLMVQALILGVPLGLLCAGRAPPPKAITTTTSFVQPRCGAWVWKP
ncbi:hypothetical protein IE81DRAFT_169240 [Ceraceosorus guamensis]|uniref:Uncharacterized protein n=1 Tax=Ceraceosorus guamensis TaxID=1522189 RepID=A0A316VVV2_9BASI|nr:hypothetical protein IE81DRAFT_169240 [Ceraceosorus guamensis]PWN41620.1 hypothetical protein IE81DRAFT_169240 [Ceraceosorus guamensis]